jgi:hypothetical protein
MEDIIKNLIGKKIKVRFDNEEYEVVVKEFLDKDKFLAVSERPIFRAVREKKGDVFFQIEESLYTFEALLWVPFHDRIIIQKISDITEDKRISERVEIGEISVEIIERSFIDRNVVSGVMVDLNETGAQIWTKQPLKQNVKLILSFKIRGKDLEIPFEIRNSTIKGFTYCYGIRFLEMSEDEKKIIKKFLRELKGESETSKIENIRVEDLLKDFDRKKKKF